MVVAGEALCLPTVLFHRRWWSVRDSWSGNQPHCHSITSQEALCRSEIVILFCSIFFFLKLCSFLFSCCVIFWSVRYSSLLLSSLYPFHILLDSEGNLYVYYLCRHPQCCVWWAVPAHYRHVFFGGRSSATQKPHTHLQPRGGKAVVQSFVWMFILYVLCWM